MVAPSSTKAKYLGCIQTMKEAFQFKIFFNDINEPQTLPIIIHCYSQSAIIRIQNHKYHARIKHIEIRRHFIRQHVEKYEVKIQFCPTESLVAVVLTMASQSQTCVVYTQFQLKEMGASQGAKRSLKSITIKPTYFKLPSYYTYVQKEVNETRRRRKRRNYLYQIQWEC